MAEQLSLDLPTRASHGRGDFYVSPANAAVLATLDDPTKWHVNKLAIVGPEGSGKSHLAAVFAAQSGGKLIGPKDLTDDVPGLAQGPLAIDDADRFSDENALFHLINLMAERGFPLLLTARSAPSRWSVNLPDLASRLGAVQVAELQTPDDALLAAVLVKNFSDRGLVPPASLVPYLVSRMERSFAAARRLVEMLDHRSSSENRPIGQRLASEILDKWASDGA